jgi:polyisoprenoid-binding protein YceI
MMKRIGMMLGTGLLLALPAVAQMGPMQPRTLAQTQAGTYVADPAHTSVTWRVNHFGLSWYTARFTKFDSTIQFDPANPPRSSVTVNIDPKSIRTDFPAPERINFDEKIAKEALQSEAHPQIRFRSTGLTATGPTTGRLTGDLTLAGVTKPVTLDVTFNGGLDNPMDRTPMLGFSARGNFKRSEWGVRNWLPVVGDEVQLVIEAEYKKQA